MNPPVQPKRSIEIKLDQLRVLPDGTLGREIARFLDENGFAPFNSGDLIQRTHDVWHVLTGLSPAEEDEMLLQAFTRAQVFRPFSAIVVLYGLLTGKLTCAEVRESIRRGKLARRLIHWDLESDWATPLEEVRHKLGIIPFTTSLKPQSKPPQGLPDVSPECS